MLHSELSEQKQSIHLIALVPTPVPVLVSVLSIFGSPPTSSKWTATYIVLSYSEHSTCFLLKARVIHTHIVTLMQIFVYVYSNRFAIFSYLSKLIAFYLNRIACNCLLTPFNHEPTVILSPSGHTEVALRMEANCKWSQTCSPYSKQPF